ncbi:major facilitator superfamily MFS_1 [Alkaliphilus metalliredigens QYMF]|uniref:Major facilitator superfamily MFS_1 n=1 Tax=Alkaliphilus metalliredigens (strain QYMF) TaxID=293826 RepID=A6TUN2_ALKMQ|nr:MFS transporter [Alkaliphilus metalliredigens]ABR49900.1 major facilitator superfamily MFS_1 [Alkaliphilus metalliredigens QYMF]
MENQSFYTQLNKEQKYILNCCFFVFAVNGLYAMILGSLLPAISMEYGLNNTVSGGLISAHQTGNLIAGFIAGILPLYLGRKKSIIFLCSFVVMGFSIMILTGNPVLLMLGFLFTGLSRGSISNFNNTTVNEVSNSSPAALNVLHSIFAVGALTAPFLVILSTNISEELGWKIAAGVIITLAIISMLLFSRMKMDDTVKQVERVKVSYEFLKNRDFCISAGILFFYLCAEAAINGWMVKYFIDSNIMTIKYAQILASLLWLVILAGRLTCAFWGNRVSKQVLLLATSCGTAVFYLLLLSTHNLKVITIAIMGLGFFMAGIYPTTVSTVGGIIKSYPMAMGVLLMLGGIGAIIMPIITGALSDAFGIFAGMSAIVVAIILMIICVLLNVLRPDVHVRSEMKNI